MGCFSKTTQQGRERERRQGTGTSPRRKRPAPALHIPSETPGDRAPDERETSSSVKALVHAVADIPTVSSRHRRRPGTPRRARPGNLASGRASTVLPPACPPASLSARRHPLVALSSRTWRLSPPPRSRGLMTKSCSRMAHRLLKKLAPHPHRGKSQMLRRVHNKKAGVHTRVSMHQPSLWVVRCVFIEREFTLMPPLTRLARFRRRTVRNRRSRRHQRRMRRNSSSILGIGTPSLAARGRRHRAPRASTRGPRAPGGRNRAARLELAYATCRQGNSRLDLKPIRRLQLAKSAQQRGAIVRLESDRVGRVAEHVDERVDETEREPTVAKLGVSLGRQQHHRRPPSPTRATQPNRPSSLK